MDAVFDSLVERKQPPSALCNPSSNPSFTGKGTWAQPVAGRYARYVDDDGDPWIDWTHDSLRIYASAFAVGTDKQALRQQLYDFWLAAGPFS